MSIILFSLLSSRNNYNLSLKTEEALCFLNNTLGLDLISIPDGDTLAYFWNKVKLADLEKLQFNMCNKLLRSRQLETFRYYDYYLVVIDGTELYRFKEKHCDNCLFEERNGIKQYFHRVLEAKIVTKNGLSVSVATEFIENPPNKEFDKQDCELKAFYRLEKKLKKLFPKLKICLLLDSLYPNTKVFEICRKNKWKHIITFKEGNLKTLWKDFNGLFNNNESAIGARLEMPELFHKENIYRWQNNMEYSGFKESILTKEYKGKIVRSFITNFKLNEEMILKFETNAQLRWKIENEGFNVQKNGNYNLEHTYTKRPKAMKVVYLLIQISHLINQLFLKADILKLIEKRFSHKYIFSKILSGIKIGWIKQYQDRFSFLETKNCQMRFNTS